MSSELIASGIRHIRDGSADYGGYQSRLETLGKAGIHHSLGFNTTVTAAQINQALTAQEPYVDFVEPQNEFDTYASTDPNWAAQIVAEQKLLYATVRANSANNGIRILGPAMADQKNYKKLGDLTNYGDGGNLHNATCNQNPGTNSDIGIAANTALVRTSTDKPVWTTETGYTDDVTRPCAIPDSIIAKYDPRTVAERFIAGEPRTLFYQFADMPVDPIFGKMGLITASGTPKPQYTSLTSMIGLLQDPGPSFTGGSLAYKLSGSTSNVAHLLLQKRDGTFILLLWIELPSWKSDSYTNIGGHVVPVAPQNVSISVSQAHSTASLYSYASDYHLAKTTLSGSASTYNLTLTDSVSFFAIK